MNILNLYCGLGGNRKLWGEEHNITAVELYEDIAQFYKDHFPKDNVVITDAHDYLLKHYKEFDFIWSSIECPSHSRPRFWASKGERYDPVYPDMKLYEEIIFLKYFCDTQWVVENVTPYYDPLIKPTIKIERHLFWSNFKIRSFNVTKNNIFDGNIEVWEKMVGFDISNYNFESRKDKILRNCVNPNIGLYILNESQRKIKPMFV
jgi:DNA (cytosine-5)-methyltransferase 1